MKLFLSIFLLFTTSLSFGKTLVIGLQGNYPPFDYVSNGRLTGFNVEIANRLCNVLGYQCVFKQKKWKDLIPAIETNEIDAIIASMAILPERKKRVLFSNKYMNIAGIFVAKKKTFLTTYVTAFDLSGKTVGIQADTNLSNYFLQTFGKNTNIKYKFYDSVNEMYNDLKSSKIDILLDDMISAYDGHVSKPAWSSMELVGSPIHEAKLLGDGAGIAVSLKNISLKNKFDIAIDKIIADGSYREIMNKYFIFDIYDFNK